MFARYLYRHSRYFALFILCAIAVGMNSFNHISRQEDPTLTNFVGNITTFFPGATPDRVEALVTRPLEDELRQISEIEEIDSTSSSGVSFISISLHWNLSDEALERVWSEVRDAMAEAARHFPMACDLQLSTMTATSFTSIVALSSAAERQMPRCPS